MRQKVTIYRFVNFQERDRAEKRPAGGEFKRNIPDDDDLHIAVLEFIRNTDAWEEMSLEDVIRKLAQQPKLKGGFQFCFSQTSFFACCVGMGLL